MLIDALLNVKAFNSFFKSLREVFFICLLQSDFVFRYSVFVTIFVTKIVIYDGVH